MTEARDSVSVYQQIPLGGPQLLVLDSGVIYDDIVYGLRHERETVLVSSARAGATRLFAAPHVYDEIYDHLDGHERRGVTRETVIARFESLYLPLIRFVDATCERPHPRAMPVWDADPDDGPTAELAVLLAPCVVLAVDPHLVDAGFGRDDWLTQVWSARELLGLDTVLLVSGNAVKVAGQRVLAGIRWFLDGLTPEEIAAGVAFGVVATALLPASAHTAIDAAARRTVGVAGELTAGGLSAGAQFLRARTERGVELQAASVGADPVASPEQQLARRLALAGGQIDLSSTSRHQMSGTSIAGRSRAFVTAGSTLALGRFLPPRS
jgi:hypothetical protein